MAICVGVGLNSAVELPALLVVTVLLAVAEDCGASSQATSPPNTRKIPIPSVSKNSVVRFMASLLSLNNSCYFLQPCKHNTLLKKQWQESGKKGMILFSVPDQHQGRDEQAR